MIAPARTRREAQHARLVAREYRDEGYRVVVEPDAARLPEFLRPFGADLLATRGKQSVVIEIASREELEASTRMIALARILELHPDWRLDLVVLRSPEVDEESPSLSLDPAELRSRARIAVDLNHSGQSQAALLLAWSAAEGALRLIARRQQFDLVDTGSPSVVNQLAELGMLQPDDARLFNQAERARNAVAHGFSSDTVTRDLVQRLADRATGYLQQAS